MATDLSVSLTADHLLRLRAPNSYVQLWFESNFLSTLLREIHEVRVEFAAVRRELRVDQLDRDRVSS